MVEPGPVLRDMAFSKDREQLYIMSERQVRLSALCQTFVLPLKTSLWLRGTYRRLAAERGFDLLGSVCILSVLLPGDGG